MDQMIPTKISVKIGSFERTYQLWETRAERSYDGFGTLTVYEDAGLRYVLIDEEHVDWQTTRYASGLRSGRPSAALFVDNLQQFLLNRLYGIDD